ncbi:hypothetical protein M407DRAFT_28992 [Tulasnella calospora MUT 4182]|uniref:Uncharacterized protein n=1 Tax=Tulasnella calospora MUT 4182 TaxID=1051891 RepID=A0A0C3Q0B9_9AGAM|nr:hypothetical protein M407DRAFT_28992 [Tulasnella calospora MUT 4182]
MFGKPLFTRPATASSPAPQFQPGPQTQSASKTPSSLFKKLRQVKNVFRRPSAAKKDANSQGTSQRRQGVPASPQPSHEGLAASAYDDGAGLYRRPHLPAPVEPTQSPPSLNLSPRAQTAAQGSTSSAAHRSNFSANGSLLLAPPQLPTALRSTTSLNASAPLALPQSVATTLATTFAPVRSSFQRSTQSTTLRSPFAPKISSPLAAPPSVATTPAASFAPARSSSHRSTLSTPPLSTYASSTLQLLTPPESVATTPASDSSPTFTSFQCSKPGDYFSPTNPLMADLEETAAVLGHQSQRNLVTRDKTINRLECF